MTEPPPFRMVLRGADPQQVAMVMTKLHTSIETLRRTVADRTLALSRVQEEQQALHATLLTAQQRVAELERGRPAAFGADRGDVGPLITSIMTLAEEEAAQIRATAASEMAQERERAAHELASELSAQQSHLDEVRVRRAELTDELSRTRAQADEENERLLDEAHKAADVMLARATAQAQDQQEAARREAEGLVEEARMEADRLHEAAQRDVEHAVTERDRILAHIREVVMLLEDLDSVLAGEERAGVV